jgi:hypothetical protein
MGYGLFGVALLSVLLYLARASKRRQRLILLASATASLLVFVLVSLQTGFAEGDTWAGLFLLVTGPFLLTWLLLEKCPLNAHPSRYFWLIPAVLLAGLAASILILVNLGLIAAPS